MAQNVKIAGALFSDVPSISVPDQNDVYHSFVDTSDANATASDIATSKTAYVNGVKIVGTGGGGGGNVTITVHDNAGMSSGTYKLPVGGTVVEDISTGQLLIYITLPANSMFTIGAVPSVVNIQGASSVTYESTTIRSSKIFWIYVTDQNGSFSLIM